jgi:hypothetical protein
MNLYVCRKHECGHEVLANEKPEPIRRTDGHVCSFQLTYERECLSCGTHFLASRPNIDYCDLDCYMASRPPTPTTNPNYENQNRTKTSGPTAQSRKQQPRTVSPR